MKLLYDLVGVEAGPAEVARAILATARSLDVPVVGAYHVTCSDETEWEVADVFHKVLAETMLPPLRADRPAAFHTMNLGGRYELGAIRIAEHHYATRETGHRAKLMVVKINSHVAVRPTREGPSYGVLVRYGVESACCGALTAMFSDGAVPPAVDELRQTFRSDGVDRIAMLRDTSQVKPAHRAILAAVANAWLQAVRAVEDLAVGGPHSPTVLPCRAVRLDQSRGRRHGTRRRPVRRRRHRRSADDPLPRSGWRAGTVSARPPRRRARSARRAVACRGRRTRGSPQGQQPRARRHTGRLSAQPRRGPKHPRRRPLAAARSVSASCQQEGVVSRRACSTFYGTPTPRRRGG